MRQAAIVAIVLALAGCGGGGGGGSAAAALSAGGTAAAPSVSGDMLALAPSRAWNYHAATTSGTVTLTLYTDPQPVNGITALVGLVSAGALTNATGGAVAGGLGVTQSSAGYNVDTFLSASNGVSGPVPGGPQLVPSTLTQGETLSPYVGVAETVTFVGSGAPGIGVCPNAVSGGAVLQGATVQYTFQGQAYRITYAPGCGITDFVTPTGAEFTLQSVASYPQLGQLSIARRVQSASYLDFARSVFRLIQHT